MAPSAGASGKGRLLPLHAAGFFSLSLMQMVGLAVPLLTTDLSLGPDLVGLILAARSVLPFLLAIHFGVLMDLFGPRPVLAASAVTGLCLAPLYPLLAAPGPLVALQLATGLAAAAGWLGAQTALARAGAGDARLTGRFSFVTAVGSMTGPLLLGLAWEAGGPMAGFFLVSAWSGGLLVATLALPRVEAAAAPRAAQPALSRLVPRPMDYVRAFALMAHPFVAFVIAMTFLRIAFVTVQESFYPVHLTERGLSPAAIGALVSLAWAVSIPAALLAAPLVRRLGSDALVLGLSVGLAVLAIAVTPFLPSVPALAIASALFGLGQGIGFPLVMSLLAGTVGAAEQGLAAGLRATANRLAAVLVPPVMGLVAGAAGLGSAFPIVGAAGGLVMLLAVIHLARAGGRR